MSEPRKKRRTRKERKKARQKGKGLPHLTQLEAMKSIRKRLPPKTRVINPKKAYDRRDKDWEEEIDKGDKGDKGDAI